MAVVTWRWSSVDGKGGERWWAVVVGGERWWSADGGNDGGDYSGDSEAM